MRKSAIDGRKPGTSVLRCRTELRPGFARCWSRLALEIPAARKLQPLWSQTDVKPPRFEDSLDAAKSRFSGIVTELHLDVPKELSQ